MVITGSSLFVEPGTHQQVLKALVAFPNVTYHVKSESGTELVVNLEAPDHEGLEVLCEKLKKCIPQIVEINHLYVSFEEEVDKIKMRSVNAIHSGGDCTPPFNPEGKPLWGKRG